MNNSTLQSIRSKTSFVLTATALATLLLGYQNCSEFKVDPAASALLNSLGATGSAGAVLVPPTDKFDQNCMSNSAFDACIIRQNTIAGRGGTPISSTPSVRRSDLVSAAIYGVKMTSLSGNGKLENATISVQSLTPASTITTTATSLKSLPSTTGSSAFEQVNTYYWINRAAEYFDARTSGALPAKGKAIKVIVDDTVTGYEPSTNTIRLKSTEALGSVAWNGDLAIHLFGNANLYLANPTGWATLSANKHSTCGGVDKGCCTAASGCAKAIRFGVGEYFASCMFPDRTKTGESIPNTGNAQQIGGLTRDVASHSASISSTIFTTSAGNADAMGILYASIWWQVRLAAGNQSNEIDRIFLEHLSLLNGSDDFQTAIGKAKSVDARLFSGRHSGKFDTQLTTRGL